MRDPLFDPKAPKKTVSLTLNSDLYAKARSAGINASRVAEQALAYEVERVQREKIAAEIHRDIEWLNAFVAEHGSFAEAVREHYAQRAEKRHGDDEPV